MGDTVVTVLRGWFYVRLEASKKIKIFFDICDIHVLKYGCSISKCLDRDLLRDFETFRKNVFILGGCTGAGRFSKYIP